MPDRRRFASVLPSDASTTSRAMTRYVVYLPPRDRGPSRSRRLPPGARATPLTVEAPGSPTSGRMPAYVPTMSPRVRSMSMRRLTVSSSSSISASGAETASGLPRIHMVGGADDPVPGPGDDEHEPARNAKRQPSAGSRSRRAMCEPGSGRICRRHRARQISPPGRPPRRPGGINRRRSDPIARPQQVAEPCAPTRRSPSRSGFSAWTRVAATAPPASAVRRTARANRASSSTPSW